MTRRARTVFIGWGAINTRLAELLMARQSPIDIVGIGTSGQQKRRSSMPEGAQLLTSPAELERLQLDLVVEAAGRAAVEQWGFAALAAAPAIILASTSALCDEALLTRLLETAEQTGSKIVLPSGAIGGIDALAGAAVLDMEEVLHQIVKPPRAWMGTPAEQLIDLARLTERRVFFSGTAREAARQYPQNANASVVTSLAGVGLDRTRVELVADPTWRTNGHRISARGAFGRIEVTLENTPLASNPKSSELTALSLVHTIENRVGPLIL